MDGLPLRKLADERSLSHSRIWERVQKEMKTLPDNTWITANCCDRWSGRLNVDGKYVSVKGYKKKIPFIYGIDFLTHDIPVGILASSENYQAFYKLFSILRTCNYPLQIVICDEAKAIKPALEYTYPKALVQLCQNHYLENIKEYLDIRHDDKYRSFYRHLKMAFNPKLSWYKNQYFLRKTYLNYGTDPLVEDIMADIMRRKDELFCYKLHINKCPHTNNLIEAYNSHLNGRLKSIKGFKSFQSAEVWLNAWMIRRRTKAFTDCRKPFKHLNGKCSLQKTLKKNKRPPSIFGVKSF